MTAPLHGASPDLASILAAYEAAEAQYESDLRLYEYKQKRWAEVWAESGVNPPPPSNAIKPVRPERPKELECSCSCSRCDGSGEVRCPECDGSGEDRNKALALKAARR